MKCRTLLDTGAVNSYALLNRLPKRKSRKEVRHMHTDDARGCDKKNGNVNGENVSSGWKIQHGHVTSVDLGDLCK